MALANKRRLPYYDARALIDFFDFSYFLIQGCWSTSASGSRSSGLYRRSWS